MNFSVILYLLGNVLLLEGVLMLLPCVTALIYREPQGVIYLLVALLCALLGYFLRRGRSQKLIFYAKEGFVAVGLSWIVLSLAGAIPFVLTGEIPSYTDALFETISGFTTTGASILRDVEALSHVSLLWRSFTHWIGGMGVIVFLLALLPASGGYNMNRMRAESPGPQVGKLVPKVSETAKILYSIYMFITVLEIVVLIVAGMPVFDALCISFGSAGTGGFGVLNDSCASYAPHLQWIITLFIILFGVNFNAYYYLLRSKNKKEAFQIEEVRVYFAVILLSVIFISFNIRSFFATYSEALRHSAFQVGSIITTTGFATTDFNLWPNFSKTILVLLMFVGACAGSTGGGIKVSRIIIFNRTVQAEVRRFIHNRSVEMVRMDGKSLDQDTVRSVSVYLVAYVLIFVASVFLLSLTGTDLVTDFTAVAATLNNIGPGLNAVGPTGNYADMSLIAKYVLMFDMLAGRLELFPMLLLVVPATYRKN